jgi:hypothetical protein
LKAFEVETFKGHLGIEGGTASVKLVYSYSIVVEMSDTQFTTVEIPVGSVLYRTYRRDNLLLRQASLFSIKDTLDTDQKLILAALAESQSNQAKFAGRTLRVWKSTFARNLRTWGRSAWKRSR